MPLSRNILNLSFFTLILSNLTYANTNSQTSLFDMVTNKITSDLVAENKSTDTIDIKPDTITPEVKAQIENTKVPEKPKTVWFSSPFRISLYEPNYLLPFYYTFSPDNAVYEGTTPDNQQIQSAEMKFQISLLIPLVYIYNDHYRFNLSYTQLSYWQFYAPQSQYFRETDYEPAFFMETDLANNITGNIGLVHESNGKGGDLERSWNRAYLQGTYDNETILARLKIWDIIFRSSSSNLHNPDIGNYLGYGELQLGYQFENKNTLTLMARSIKHPTFELNWSFPIYGVLNGYIQYFSGYGQSLIEYNHHTNSIGAGISLNQW